MLFLYDYEFYMQICALTMYITMSRLCVALPHCFMHVLQNLFFIIFKSDWNLNKSAND